MRAAKTEVETRSLGIHRKQPLELLFLLGKMPGSVKIREVGTVNSEENERKNILLAIISPWNFRHARA
jgi:hypothetical protein